MRPKNYIERFDHGPGGWFGWIDNFAGPKRLEEARGALISRSPWWIDYNHAPPGAGYLHMAFCLLTKGIGYGEAYLEAGGLNRFIEGDFPTDFTGAEITFRVKGELETRGAQFLLLVQQTMVAVPDESQWTCLGARHDRAKSYDRIPIESILKNVNETFF